MAEIKQQLRRFEFPQSAHEALLQVQQLCCHASPQHQRLLMDIQEEFIFCETDKRGVRKKRLTSVQELQLLQVLSQYCEMQTNDILRNTVFLTLFHHDDSNSSKIRLLCKLVSMAIAGQNAAVLNSSAIWMQQLGCTSNVVVSLVRELITDFCIMVPRTESLLTDLAAVCPQFTTHFITASTQLYNRLGYAGSKNGGGRKEPPLKLLELITTWVTSNPQLCLTPLTSDLHNMLPRGSIIMTAVTPLPGLIRWCVEAPLVSSSSPQYRRPGGPPHSTPTSGTADVKPWGGASPGSSGVNKETCAVDRDPAEVYSQLHLGVLEALLHAGKTKSQLYLKNVMVTRDFVDTCESVYYILSQQGNTIDHRNIQLAMDRLGQALQLTVATGCIHGNLEDVFVHLSRLPENRLLKLIMKNCRK